MANVFTRNRSTGDMECEHGHAADVHCCACRRSGFFPPYDCRCGDRPDEVMIPAANKQENCCELYPDCDCDPSAWPGENDESPAWVYVVALVVVLACVAIAGGMIYGAAKLLGVW